ncbi:hypothetical protein GE061_018884 [Apolygus lucorum]|uniref:Uncharacterized protein n=1 Tax=Apolygus lucorum TaxID=248454 RepID=A0A6A4JX80_APOLU|nr:hypothetical protein GE061_018884 [Apolygus lucorum]
MSDEYYQVKALYWPSKWSKRLAEDIICSKHYEIAYGETLANKRSILSEENTRYGEAASEIMDIYGKNIPPDAPWFIYLHGGYWVEFTKESSAYCAHPLWKAGIRVCIPDYDIAPKVTLTQIIEQMRKMTEFIIRRAVQEGSRYQIRADQHY